ncbi:MaoC/PaaZ C-terminal domain-containing protein [Leucobacter chromiireducens]|uniref:MaoC/PaaZ C-terminal domain-containing protein n=1 Tax=Leucobacter chromiireducens TaxID=283877 RepID=UPI001928DCAA
MCSAQAAPDPTRNLSSTQETARDPGRAPLVLHGLAGVRAAAGAELGPTTWFEVTQERVDDFARVTEDWQPIHCDPELAAASMFGGTIAHGYLTVALLSRFARELYRIEGTRTVVNYGLDRVRFPAPLRVGGRVRARARVGEATARGALLDVPVTYTLEAEGEARPVLVAETRILVDAP